MGTMQGIWKAGVAAWDWVADLPDRAQEAIGEWWNRVERVVCGDASVEVWRAMGARAQRRYRWKLAALNCIKWGGIVLWFYCIATPLLLVAGAIALPALVVGRILYRVYFLFLHLTGRIRPKPSPWEQYCAQCAEADRVAAEEREDRRGRRGWGEDVGEEETDEVLERRRRDLERLLAGVIDAGGAATIPATALVLPPALPIAPASLQSAGDAPRPQRGCAGSPMAETLGRIGGWMGTVAGWAITLALLGGPIWGYWREALWIVWDGGRMILGIVALAWVLDLDGAAAGMKESPPDTKG